MAPLPDEGNIGQAAGSSQGHGIQHSPPTTTISTIAIRAQDTATIVVALLKTDGYVKLRIDEMNPQLLEIGKKPEETSKLLEIHEELMHRIQVEIWHRMGLL